MCKLRVSLFLFRSLPRRFHSPASASQSSAQPKDPFRSAIPHGARPSRSPVLLPFNLIIATRARLLTAPPETRFHTKPTPSSDPERQPIILLALRHSGLIERFVLHVHPVVLDLDLVLVPTGCRGLRGIGGPKRRVGIPVAEKGRRRRRQGA